MTQPHTHTHPSRSASSGRDERIWGGSSSRASRLQDCVCTNRLSPSSFLRGVYSRKRWLESTCHVGYLHIFCKQNQDPKSGGSIIERMHMKKQFSPGPRSRNPVPLCRRLQRRRRCRRRVVVLHTGRRIGGEFPLALVNPWKQPPIAEGHESRVAAQRVSAFCHAFGTTTAAPKSETNRLLVQQALSIQARSAECTTI